MCTPSVSPSEQVPLSWAAGGGTLHLLQLIIVAGGVIAELRGSARAVGVCQLQGFMCHCNWVLHLGLKPFEKALGCHGKCSIQ